MSTALSCQDVDLKSRILSSHRYLIVWWPANLNVYVQIKTTYAIFHKTALDRLRIIRPIFHTVDMSFHFAIVSFRRLRKWKQLSGSMCFTSLTHSSSFEFSPQTATMFASPSSVNKLIMCPCTRHLSLILCTIVTTVIAVPVPTDVPSASPTTVTVSGSAFAREFLTFDIQGPSSAEDDSPTPFLRYKMDIIFARLPISGTEPVELMVVPGYFAADGNAAETYVFFARQQPPLQPLPQHTPPWQPICVGKLWRTSWQ